MNTIGIVVPIYNVAKYLHKCLQSIQNQSYKHFQVVLVNDGSTDFMQDSSDFNDSLESTTQDSSDSNKAQTLSQSLKIALEYVASDSRFVLFDKKNGGLSSARNVGIAYFRNEIIFDKNANEIPQNNNISRTLCYFNNQSMRFYASQQNPQNLQNPQPISHIIFLDSDDWWEKDLLLECLKSAQKHNAEIVWFNWNTFKEEMDGNIAIATSDGGGQAFSWIDYYGYNTTQKISGKDVLLRAKNKGISLLANAWDIFIDWQYLQNIRLTFIDGVLYEDVAFAILLFAQSKSILALQKRLTNYLIRQNSITTYDATKTLPVFANPLLEHFSSTNEAWRYLGVYSWCVMLCEFVAFCDRNGEIGTLLMECYLRHQLLESSQIMIFENDPYRMKDNCMDLIKRFQPLYLPKPIILQIFYDMPLLWQIKKLWIKIRYFIKGLLKKK